MTDDEPFGVLHVALQLGRQQTRRRGSEHDRRAGRPAGAGEHRLLEGEPLGGALLHEVGAGDCLVGGADEAQRALGRPWRIGQAVERPPGVVEHLADLARRVGIGVVEVDVDAVEHEAGRPATTDHAAAEQPDPVEARGSGTSRPLHELELVPHLIGALDPHVHALQDLDGAGDELGVGGEMTAPEVQVVLEADAHVAAGERGHGDERELHPRDRERREHRARAARR